MRPDELQLINDYKIKLLTSVSNELRTPLNSISSNLQQAIQYEDYQIQSIDDLLKTFIFPAFCSVSLLDIVIDDIVDYANIHLQNFQLNLESFNLNELLEEMITIYSPLAQAKGLELQIAYNKQKLPEIIHSDKNRIKQVMANLLTNAFKNTSQGYIMIEATLSDNKDIKIAIKDSGCGISPQQQKILFKQFQALFIKCDTEEAYKTCQQQFSQTRGSGMGLTFCSVVVAGLKKGGQKLDLQSTYGKGSQFSFYITDRDPQKTNVGMKQFTRQQTNESQVMRSYYDLFLTSNNQSENQSQNEYLNSQIKNNILSKAQSILSQNQQIHQQQSTIQGQEQENKTNYFNQLNYSQTNSLSVTNSIFNKGSFKKQHFNNQKMQTSNSHYGKLLANKSPQQRHQIPPRALTNNIIDSIQMSHGQSLFLNNQQNKPSQFKRKSFENQDSSQQFPQQSIFNQQNYHQQKQNTQNTIHLKIDDNQSYNNEHSNESDNEDLEQQTQKQISSKFKSSPFGFKRVQTMYKNIQQSQQSEETDQDLQDNEEDDNTSKCDIISESEESQSHSQIADKVKRQTNYRISIKQPCECSSILIVDDDGFNLQCLQKIISQLGMRTDIAQNGQIALDMVKKQKKQRCCQYYKLIFMDIDMPVMNGYESSQKISQFYLESSEPVSTQDYSIIAYTAVSDNNHLKKCKESNIKQSLKKPSKPEVFRDIISKIFIINTQK